MGIAADPNETVKVTLDTDAAVAADRRPAFVYRHLTSRQASERRRLVNVAMKEVDDAKRFQMEADLLAFNLVSCRNLVDAEGKALEFPGKEPLRVHDALTEGEIWQVIADVPSRMRLAADAKKKSASSPATGTASSAPTAPSGASA